ncbi:MAG: type II toxin-antitoxin system Phd/YefM family antitoxin [Capsulimonas sp.]|uniref:type II toxin-antitoxin system Phd/YefM family antitoxin n=1 Tax=Capsulimonas sp. TaxID=2494211 RepID=UPI00326466CE
MSTKLSIEEFKSDPAAYLHRAQAGEAFIVLEAGRQIAEITPIVEVKPVSTQARRPFGLCAGEFTVPKDFDAPLPDDILQGFS